MSAFFTKILSKILSILFRLILLIYGFFILTNKENVWNFYVYLIIMIPYVFIYYHTLFRDGVYSKVRLLNDYVFITLIVYGKGLDYATLSYILFPILNSPNHSGNKKSFLLYVFFMASLIITNNFKIELPFIFITIIFIVINLLIDIRNKFLSTISELNVKIEEYLEHKLVINKSYKVYAGIIEVLNNAKGIVWLYKPFFKDIVCFRIKDDNTLMLENSSTFIWSYSIDKTNSQILLSKPDFYGSNIKIKINDDEANKNFYIKSANNKYVFIFLLDIESSYFYNLYYINILKPIIARIARVINLDNTLKTENKKILRTFRDKYFYMQNAEKAMHFIRNRFNTLDNFIEMSKDNIRGEMDERDLQLYSTELERLERNYKMLLERIKSILNKSSKPFSASQLEIKTPNFLFNSIRSIWSDYFSDFNFTLNWNISNVEKTSIYCNIDGLFILLTDWISNLEKYSISDEQVVFEEDVVFYIVVFKNKFKESHRKDLNELMSDFNSTERDKILQRTSHGIIIMKSILEEMGVKGIISVNDVLEFKLFFKKIENENSDF